MQHHFIIELLGIKDKHVDLWNIEKDSNKWLIELHTKVKKQKCPLCKERTKRIHSYRKQSIQGPILANTPVKIIVKKRRYLCTHCRHTNDYKWWIPTKDVRIP
ncbi:transposase family protein [Virgibacillus proomii]|uniref:transposase family protein n=1 Tax=Virgibacillus proomii TaxID=84407 RepID=UPI002816727E|nr:transposase family protein [Virgibacillus proomii]